MIVNEFEKNREDDDKDLLRDEMDSFTLFDDDETESDEMLEEEDFDDSDLYSSSSLFEDIEEEESEEAEDSVYEDEEPDSEEVTFFDEIEEEEDEEESEAENAEFRHQEPIIVPLEEVKTEPEEIHVDGPVIVPLESANTVFENLEPEELESEPEHAWEEEPIKFGDTFDEDPEEPEEEVNEPEPEYEAEEVEPEELEEPVAEETEVEPEEPAEEVNIETKEEAKESLCSHIIEKLPSNSLIKTYLKRQDEDMLKDISYTIEQARLAWVIDGKDKMFTIPETDISVIVCSSLNDPMAKIQRQIHVAALMIASQKTRWNVLFVTFDSEQRLDEAVSQEISRATFSDWQWKRAQSLADLISNK